MSKDEVTNRGFHSIKHLFSITCVLFQLCQPIRLMLGYTGTEFEEKNYPVGDAPDYDKSEWLAVKFKLGLAFPNVSSMESSGRLVLARNNNNPGGEQRVVRSEIKNRLSPVRIQLRRIRETRSIQVHT